MGNRERHHVFVCLLFLLHRLTFCPRFKSYLMTRGWTMLKEKRHTGTSTMRDSSAYILSKKHHEGWVFSHVLRSPIDSTLRSKASVVCFCECPRTCFCYTWTTILKFGMAPAITGFLIFWKTCILPRHGFGTKLIFSLATKWLRIRGCAGDMLFTCCEGGDTLNRNWNQPRLDPEQQDKICLPKVVKPAFSEKMKSKLMLSLVAKSLRTRAVLGICCSYIARVVTL